MKREELVQRARNILARAKEEEALDIGDAEELIGLLAAERLPSEPGPLTNEEYVKSAGQICPFCKGEDDIVEGIAHTQIEGAAAWQPVRCIACKAEWQDVYRLTGWEQP